MTKQKHTLTDDQFILLKDAVEACLTDEELIDSLISEITEKEFEDNYFVVRQLRLRLKQKLQATAIKDAELGQTTSTISVPKSKNGPGGKQPGAGRPKGSGNRITAKEILESIQTVTGESFEMLLAQGYKEAIDRNDRVQRFAYEKLIMSKVVNDQVEVVTVPGSDQPFVGFTIVPLANKNNDE